MPRPLRIEYTDAYYHVMNRGNRREDIFLTDQDCKVFLEGLADSCEIYHIKLITSGNQSVFQNLINSGIINKT